MDRIGINQNLNEFNIYDPLITEKEIKKIKTRRRLRKMKREETKKFDVNPYVGEKSKIVKAEIISGKFGEVMYIETDTIPLKGDDTLPDDKKLRASIMLGVQKNDDGELTIGIDTKADKWLKSHGVDVEKDLPEKVVVGTQLKVLIGKEVTAQKNENGFLEIA